MMKSGIARARGQAFILALSLGLLVAEAHAQNQTIGKEFQGTIFSPALEDVSLSRGSVLQPTLILESAYNNNLLQSQAGPQLAGAYQLAEGEVSYDIRHSGDDLLLRYWGGERFYPNYRSLNSSMQDARLQWQHRLTDWLQLTATSRYASLPAGAVLETNPEQGFPLLVSNLNSYSFLQQKFTTLEATVSATAKLSRHTFAVIGSNLNDTTHSSTNFISTKELDAYAGFYYAPTRHQDIGIVYSQQWMKFGLGFGSSEVKSLFLSYSLQLTSTLSVSAFGGPAQDRQLASAISSPSGTPPGVPPGLLALSETTHSGMLGGVKIERRHRHNVMRASYTQLVTTGGGYLSTVLQQMAELSASRSLSPHLDLSLGGTYSQSSQVGLSSLSFNTFYVEPSLRYQLSRNFKLTLRDSYGKIAGLAGAVPIRREEVALRLEYTFPQISIGK
jgi:hypothetical protein